MKLTINKIYIASKAHHRPIWRLYRDNKGIAFTSRWINVPDEFIGRSLPEELDFKQLWIECVEDVINADILVLFCEEGDVLKGALFEMGIALAAGKMILACGHKETILKNGSWIAHPLIFDMTEYPIDYVLGFASGFDAKSWTTEELNSL